MEGGRLHPMNIIIHFPTAPSDINALKNKIATVHADAVNSYIQNLTCPKEQKLVLVKAIQNALQ